MVPGRSLTFPSSDCWIIVDVIRQRFTLGRCFGVALWLAAAVRPAGAQTAPAPATASPAAASPALPADRGRFAAIWVTPIATHQFQGAGLEAGYHYRWLAGLYRLGFVQNGYAPFNDPSSLDLVFERTQRLFLELELDGQWRYRDAVTVALGAGAVFIDNRVAISSMNGFSWFTATDDRGRIRPLVSVTMAGPLFETGVSFYLGPNPEARLSLGVCWGRHTRR